MTDYTSIRVTEAAKDEAEDSKRDDETWNDYLRRCTDNPPETREFVPAADVAGGEIGDVDLGTDEIAGSLSTIEERTGRIERLLEDLGGGR